MATKYRIAPASNPTDFYAAGIDGNEFGSEAEAEEAIDSLRALGGEWDVEWVMVEVGDGPL